MSNDSTSEKPETLQTAIDRLFTDMANVSPDSPEFAAMVTQMDTLYKLREVDTKVVTAKHVNASAWAAIGANLLGIGMIVGHERAAVVTSKALGFVMKLVR